MKKVGLYAILLAALALAAPPFSDPRAEENPNLDAERNLRQMQDSFKTANFELYFVKQYPMQSEPVVFSHGVVGGREYRHLLYLNGLPMGYFTRDGDIYYFRAGSPVEKVSHGVSPFLPDRLSTIDLDALYKNYVPVVTGRSRIAGRDALMVRLSPRANDRYGYMLYLDEETRILLQVDVINPLESSVEEYYLAAHFAPADEPSKVILSIDNGFRKQFPGADPGDLANAPAPGAAGKRSGGEKGGIVWKLSYVPPGYELVYADRSVVPGTETEADHLLFSDGISDFSAYRIKALEGRSIKIIRQGATNLLRQPRGDREIIVAGDIPLETAEKIAKSYDGRDDR